MKKSLPLFSFLVLCLFVSCSLSSPTPQTPAPPADNPLSPRPPIPDSAITNTNLNTLIAIFMAANNDLIPSALSDLYEIEKRIDEFRAMGNDVIIAYYGDDGKTDWDPQGWPSPTPFHYRGFLYPIKSPREYYPTNFAGAPFTFHAYFYYGEFQDCNNNINFSPYSPFITNFPPGVQNPANFYSSQSDALDNFLTYIEKKFQYSNLILILWDHGSSYFPMTEDDRTNIARLTNDRKYKAIPKLSFNIFYDQNTSQSLSIPNLKYVLDKHFSTKKATVIAFDACVMGTFDILYELYPYAEYLVGANYFVSFSGFPYEAILHHLKDKKTPQEIFNGFINAWNDYNNEYKIYESANFQYSTNFKYTFKNPTYFDQIRIFRADKIPLLAQTWKKGLQQIITTYETNREYIFWASTYGAGLADNTLGKYDLAMFRVYTEDALEDTSQPFAQEMFSYYQNGYFNSLPSANFTLDKISSIIPSFFIPLKRTTVFYYTNVYNPNLVSLLRDIPELWLIWTNYTMDYGQYYDIISNLVQTNRWGSISSIIGPPNPGNVSEVIAIPISSTNINTPLITKIGSYTNEIVYVSPYDQNFTNYLKFTNTTDIPNFYFYSSQISAGNQNRDGERTILEFFDSNNNLYQTIILQDKDTSSPPPPQQFTLKANTTLRIYYQFFNYPDWINHRLCTTLHFYKE